VSHKPVVAIDGPAGAGKSTVAKRLARRLGVVLLDTGALYRTVALVAARREIPWDQDAALTTVAAQLAVAGAIVFEPCANGEPAAGGKGQRVWLTEPSAPREDVSEAIRTPEISMGASRVSAAPGVRAALLNMQRAVANDGVVAEGRDIGTVVFPNADAKFFLTASDEVRARRRQSELEAAGDPVDFEQLLAEVRKRDKQDSERSVAPLKQADDALLIDSTGRPIDEIVAEMAAVVATKLSGA